MMIDEEDGRRIATPTFSVIVPAYNAGRTISAAVGSALRQTRRDLEVIVVDDGSRDDTASVLARIDDPRLRIVSQANRGLPAARNAGIAASRGTYVALLDSDDLLLPRYLDRCQAAIAATPRAGFAYTDAYVFDDLTGRVRVRSAMARSRPPEPPPAGDRFLLELLKRNFVYVSATVPRAVLDHVGMFDESLPSSEDYDLWLRILLAGYQAAWVPGREAAYRKHPGQMSAQFTTMARSLIDVYDGLQSHAMPTAEHRAELDRRRRAARRQLLIWSRLSRLIPLGLVRSMKLAGIHEEWYDTPPAAMAGLLANLDQR